MSSEGGADEGKSGEGGAGSAAGGPMSPRSRQQLKSIKFLLKVRLIGAHGLKSVQMFGTQDPYVEIQCCGKKKKSKTHFDGGTEPSFLDSPPFEFAMTGAMMNEGDMWVVIKDHGSFGSDSQIGWTQIPLQPFLTPHKEQEKFPVTSDGKINGDIEIEIESTQTEGDVFVPKVKTGAVTSALKGALKRAGSMGVGLTAPADGSDTEEESEDEDEIEDYGYVFVEATKGERGLFGCGSAWKLRYLHLYNAENLRVYEYKDDIRTHCKPKRAYEFYSGVVEKGIRSGAPYPYVLKVDFKSRVGNRDVGTITFACTQERQMEAWYRALHECFDAAPIVRDDV